jgi:hypothetical protein
VRPQDAAAVPAAVEYPPSKSPAARTHPAVYKARRVVPAGFMAVGPRAAQVAGSKTAQSPRPHQLRCGAAGIGNLEEGDFKWRVPTRKAHRVTFGNVLDTRSVPKRGGVLAPFDHQWSLLNLGVAPFARPLPRTSILA